MTVENLLSLLIANPPPRHNMAFEFADQDPRTAAPHIAIPVRTRHMSMGSTGSYGSAKSSPPGSPPLQDYITLHMSSLQLVQQGSGKKLERSMSMPPVSDPQGPLKNVNPTRYKTELCRPYEESGYCKYGEKCQFAHGGPEQRSMSRHPKYKTELCRTYHTVGFCPYGPRCHFIHNEDELKLYQINHMKHQQLIQQVAQQVAQQQQVLSHVVLQQQPGMAHKGPMTLGAPLLTAQPMQHSNTRDYTGLSLAMALGSTVDSPPASVSSGSPSLSPTSMLSDDVFSGVPTPPPGFSALPPRAPQSYSRVFNYADMPVSGMAPASGHTRNGQSSSQMPGLQPLNVVPMTRQGPQMTRKVPEPLTALKPSSPGVTTEANNEVLRCTPPTSPLTMTDAILEGIRLPMFNAFRQ